MSHQCHATACARSAPPAMFMCAAHWYALPWPMRTKIWRTYRPGQEEDKRPSAAYCKAAKQAVCWLAAKEGRVPDTVIYNMFLAAAEEEWR